MRNSRKNIRNKLLSPSLDITFPGYRIAIVTCPVLEVGNRVGELSSTQENAEELIVEVVDERIIMIIVISGISTRQVKQARSRTGSV